MKLVLLDRDGVINVSPGKSYITSPHDLSLIDGAGEAISLLNKAHIKTAIITNQSIVGQGGITLVQLNEIHRYLSALLKKEGAYIDHIFFCTDAPHQPTFRRKPNPGMIQEALAYFDALPHKTPLIGDALVDLEAAFKGGCPRHLVRTGHGKRVEEQGIPHELLPVHIHNDLLSAVHFLLKNNA